MAAVSKTWVSLKGLPLPSAACEILGVSQLTSPGAQCLHLGWTKAALPSPPAPRFYSTLSGGSLIP